MEITALFNYILLLIILTPITAHANVVIERFNNNELSFSDVTFSKNIERDLHQSIVSEIKRLDSTSKSSEQVCDNSLIYSLKNKLKSASRGLEDEYNMIIGYAFEKCKNLEQALEYYKKSKQIRNKNALVAFKISLLECKNKNYTQCKNYLDEAQWQGLKELDVLNYNRALLLSLENKTTEAILIAEKSLKQNPGNVLAAKLVYFIKLELIATSKNKDLKNKLQNDLHTDIARIYTLNPKELGYGIQYAKNLLTTGDFIKSQNKLQVGESVVEKMMVDHPKHTNELYMLKIQFLEKQQKFPELEEFLNALKKQKNISPELKAKIRMQHDENSETSE